MNFYKVKGFWLFRMEVTSAKPKLQLNCKGKTSFSFISTQLLCLIFSQEIPGQARDEGSKNATESKSGMRIDESNE